MPKARKKICAVIVAAIYFPPFAESIIDTTAFNFRVRNGTGWFHGVKPPQLLNTFYLGLTQDGDLRVFLPIALGESTQHVQLLQDHSGGKTRISSVCASPNIFRI